MTIPSKLENGVFVCLRFPKRDMPVVNRPFGIFSSVEPVAENGLHGRFWDDLVKDTGGTATPGKLNFALFRVFA